MRIWSPPLLFTARHDKPVNKKNAHKKADQNTLLFILFFTPQPAFDWSKSGGCEYHFWGLGLGHTYYPVCYPLSPKQSRRVGRSKQTMHPNCKPFPPPCSHSWGLITKTISFVLHPIPFFFFVVLSIHWSITSIDPINSSIHQFVSSSSSHSRV